MGGELCGRETSSGRDRCLAARSKGEEDIWVHNVIRCRIMRMVAGLAGLMP